MLKLTLHTDLGHGWLEVPKAIVEAVGVFPSQFSYQKDDLYFLEEDCDAAEFTILAKRAGLKLEINHKDFQGNHPIRNYQRINDPRHVSPFKRKSVLDE